MRIQDAFYLPGNEEFGDVTLSGGIYAAAFSDDENVMKVMEFLASTDYADTRAQVAGYLSPNRNVDASNYPSELEQNFGEILANADAWASLGLGRREALWQIKGLSDATLPLFDAMESVSARGHNLPPGDDPWSAEP